jgi:hypothetical protein
MTNEMIAAHAQLYYDLDIIIGQKVEDFDNWKINVFVGCVLVPSSSVV